MKISYIVALLVLFLMMGCAAQQPAAPAAPPSAAPETPPTAPETPPTEEAPTIPAAPAAGEIAVTKAGMDPSELSVTAGAMITLKAVEGDHKFTVNGESTPTVKEGTSYDVTLKTEGKVRIFDIFTKKSATITVTK